MWEYGTISDMSHLLTMLKLTSKTKLWRIKFRLHPRGWNMQHWHSPKVMRLIWLASLIKHLTLAPNRQRNLLIKWVSNTWWCNLCLDIIWVSHLLKSQTTPTILHNECCSPSYDTLDFCARGGQIRRWHVVMRSLEQHLPQLRFQHFQIIWSSFTIAILLKLLMLKSIGWMIT